MTSGNEMNNQAAKTMPVSEEWALRAMAKNYGDGPHRWDRLDREVCERAADEIKALHERVAALLQTAGVADIGPGVRGDMARAWLAVTETLDQVFPQWIESDKTGRECACDAIRFLAERSRIAAAPAASGGECQADDDLPGMWERADLIGGMTDAAPQPPAAASVSERARTMFEAWVRSWCEHSRDADAALTMTNGCYDSEEIQYKYVGFAAALEQALTQQRGPGEAVALVPKHYAENVGYAAAMLETSASLIDRHNAPALRTLLGILTGKTAPQVEAKRQTGGGDFAAAERLCRIYFEIAAEAVGEEAVRTERDRRIAMIAAAAKPSWEES